MPPTTRQSDVVPITDIPWAQAVNIRLSSGSVSAGDLVQVVGQSGGVLTVVQADASAIATAKGMLLIAIDAISSGDGATYKAVPWKFVTDVDTSAFTASGDAAFLSNTAGGYGALSGDVQRIVGQVLGTPHASTGAVLLDPNGVLGLPEAGGITWSDAIVADSTAITNTTTKTYFDKTLSIPLGSLGAGQTLYVKAAVRHTATNGTDTSTVTLEVYDGTASRVLVLSNAVDVADNDVAIMEGWLTARAAPGAAVDCEGGGTAVFDTGTGTEATATSLPDAATLATNLAMTVRASETWSVANAGNSCILTSLSAYIV